MNERQIHILGAKIDLLSQQEVSDRLKHWLTQSKGRYLVTLNPEIALLAEREDGYQKVLNRSDLTVADGIGLRVGAKLFGIAVPPRITGRQIVDMLCKEAVAGKHGLYLLGAGPGVAQRAAKALQKHYPGLVISGAEEGISAGQFDDLVRLAPSICERINRSGAHILLVAFGAPKQERFIAKYLQKMPGLRIAVGVGGLFDYVSGEVRAPGRFWRQHGLEWLFRLLTQPRRWRRIFDATAVFLSRVVVWKVRIQSRYRRNVVGFIVDRDHQRVLLVSPWWATENRWQFPQGGIDRGESPEQAVLREMNEELGTSAFRVMRFVPRIHRYEWPKWYQFVKGYKGQDQDVFMLEFTGKDEDIDLSKAAELQHWKWVRKDEVLSQLAQPRREIGAIALSLLN